MRTSKDRRLSRVIDARELLDSLSISLIQLAEITSLYQTLGLFVVLFNKICMKSFLPLVRGRSRYPFTGYRFGLCHLYSLTVLRGFQWLASTTRAHRWQVMSHLFPLSYTATTWFISPPIPPIARVDVHSTTFESGFQYG